MTSRHVPAATTASPRKLSAPAPFAAELVQAPAPEGDIAQVSSWLAFLTGQGVHPKLNVSNPGDSDEREADAVADRIMRMSAPPATALGIDRGPARIARGRCADCEQKDDVVQPKAEAPPPGHAPVGVHAELARPGAPLDASTRGFFEGRFGQDFGHVRVHYGASAAESARAVAARAYTFGSHVVFGDGSYAPHSQAGRRLLAHELTHVVQDSGTKTPKTGALAGGRVIRRQAIDVDVEAATPEAVESARVLGVDLPQASAQALEPRHHSQYIENRFHSIGYSIYLGGFLVYVDGADKPLYIPNHMLDLGASTTMTADPVIYRDFPTAMAHVPLGPPQAGHSFQAGFFWSPDNSVIAPTIFTAATTPRIIQTYFEARRQLAEYVQEQLVAVAIGLVGGMLIRAAVRLFPRSGRVKAPSPLAKQSAQARQLARDVKARGDPVVANMGGAGGAHEPPGAININNQAVARRSIPNHVNADASDIGELFDAGMVDQVVGHHMPPSVINWSRAVPGINKVLRPGGQFRFDWRGGTPEAGQVAKLLKDAGFKDVQNMSDALVTATKR